MPWEGYTRLAHTWYMFNTPEPTPSPATGGPASAQRPQASPSALAQRPRGARGGHAPSIWGGQALWGLTGGGDGRLGRARPRGQEAARQSCALSQMCEVTAGESGRGALKTGGSPEGRGTQRRPQCQEHFKSSSPVCELHTTARPAAAGEGCWGHVSTATGLCPRVIVTPGRRLHSHEEAAL